MLEVSVKVFSLVSVAKTDTLVHSLLTEYSQGFVQKYTLYFLIFYSKLYLAIPFRSDG